MNPARNRSQQLATVAPYDLRICAYAATKLEPQPSKHPPEASAELHKPVDEDLEDEQVLPL